LQYLGFGNLQWTNYEIENTANTVASYNVYRDNTSSGNFQLLQVIPGNNNTFTDINYASYPNAQYRVDVNWLTGGSCNPTARAVTTSQSNIRRIGATTGMAEAWDRSAVSVYPNPAKGRVSIERKGACTMVSGALRITDSNGGEKYLLRDVGPLVHLDVSSLPSGVYLISWVNGDAFPLPIGKLVVE
jgi:hypothetical protein